MKKIFIVLALMLPMFLIAQETQEKQEKSNSKTFEFLSKDKGNEMMMKYIHKTNLICIELYKCLCFALIDFVGQRYFETLKISDQFGMLMMMAKQIKYE